jgi:hypothetical protein
MTERARRREQPVLTTGILEDDDQVMGWAGRTLNLSKGHKALTRRVLELHAKLQATTDQNAWAAYMMLEQAVNDRAAFETLVASAKALGPRTHP